MNATMTERFNVAGALLVKLFGRPAAEAESFRGRAARVRDIGVSRPCTADVLHRADAGRRARHARWSTASAAGWRSPARSAPATSSPWRCCCPGCTGR